MKTCLIQFMEEEEHMAPLFKNIPLFLDLRKWRNRD